MREEHRANNFDALRLFAAFTVAAQHSVFLLQAPLLFHHPADRFWFFDGVAVFFVISGFLVFRSAQACLDRGLAWRLFFTNRFLRIGPAVYAYMLVATAILLVLGVIRTADLGSPGYLAWAASSLLLLPILTPVLFHGFGIGILNVATWTIPVEVSFYVVVPALVLLKRRSRARMLPVVGILSLLGMLGQRVFNDGSLAGLLLRYTFPAYLWLFGMGILWSVAHDRIRWSGRWAVAALVLYLAVRYGPAGDLTEGESSPWAVAWGIPLSYLTVWFALYGPSVFNRVTHRVGDLSFGIYLWHAVVINLVAWLALHRGFRVPGSNALNAVVLGGTALTAAASWWLIERPALGLKPFTSMRQGPQERTPG